jgi:hypothetical protein
MATVLPPRLDAPDPRIRHPLDRMRGTIRRYVLLDGLLAAALFLVAWFWVGLALDFGLFKLTGLDWVQDAPWAFRALALGVLSLSLLAVVALTIAVRLTRQFSYPALALVLEKRYPKLLGDRLITAVELADVKQAERYGYSPEMVEQTITEAREKVGQVPVGEVFNWGRLWRKLLLVAALMVGLLGLSYAFFALVGGNRSPGAFGWRFGDVAGIWGERNVLLKNTPWPRRAHLELIDFDEKEHRIGKDAPPPKVRVRAYRWVTSDNTSRDGWRPLRWDDLTPDLLGSDVTVTDSLTVREETDWRPADRARAALVGGFGLAAERPVEVRTVALGELTVDAVANNFANRPETEAVFARLDELAARPSMSPTLRKLDVPEEVTLTYTGKADDPAARGQSLGRTSGTVRLTREPSGDFSAEVTGLKESVTFVVRAEDFRTAPRDIILVPPPMLVKLARVESQPAYLYHPAPQDSAGERPFAMLKGLRQVLGEKNFSLTGEKSIAPVPVGSELTITGVADKPLAKVYVQPRAGRVPGVPPGSTAPVEIPVEGDHFSLTFAGPDRVLQSVEFEFVMEDADGVKSSRPVVIQAVDDQPPQVQVAVTVLRKIGNVYWCTPVARVPLDKDSRVTDDHGLSRVEYQFTVTRQEAAVVVGLQLQALAGLWAYAPLVPNLGSAFGPTASVVTAAQLGKGEQKQFAALPAAPFERAYDGLPKSTLTLLKEKLAQPPANPDAADAVRDIKFNQDADVFDLTDADKLLEARGQKMRATEIGAVQPRYRVELEVVATDTNVETGPKQGRNLEPIRLLVVSEADLLAEISKDEEGLIGKLDDAIRQLKGAQLKLRQQSDRLLSPTPPADILLAARVRAEDISQDVAKARDLTQGVANEYGRLRLEVEMNRCNESVGRRYESEIIRPLEGVLLNQFKAADTGLAGFRDPLAAGVRPDDAAMTAARANLATLILALESIRARMGESLSVAKLRDDLRKIIEQQKVVSTALEGIKKVVIDRLFAPQILPAPPVVLARGEKKSVKHAINWNVYDKGELKVRIEPPSGSNITAPGELTVKDDRNDFEYELTAGDKPGDYVVKVIPSAGEPVEVKVTVK